MSSQRRHSQGPIFFFGVLYYLANRSFDRHLDSVEHMTFEFELASRLSRIVANQLINIYCLHAIGNVPRHPPKWLASSRGYRFGDVHEYSTRQKCTTILRDILLPHASDRRLFCGGQNFQVPAFLLFFRHNRVLFSNNLHRP
jgi:hypothetical protein